jgi:hypothetical protein
VDRGDPGAPRRRHLGDGDDGEPPGEHEPGGDDRGGDL